MEKLIEALLKLIEKPISPWTTKVALETTFYLVSTHERIAARVSESRIVPLLLETLVNADRSTTEKALGVLDGALGYGRDREAACSHPLAVPVLVKNMLWVSETATQFAVSALWKLCKSERQGERAAKATKVGSFQKLLILLQVGCSTSTKEKVSKLLRLPNTQGKLRGQKS
ncbi:U-box domain-containing protein 21-like [Zingiber officinale]|uniref:U-box domain-containing protein 21-like n=1 Tax=Zingiber officinale TaxID=94328 RepID=UPI001C4C6920|nr:U-box domain-containing protein 21-like [Zingiber officinale]